MHKSSYLYSLYRTYWNLGRCRDQRYLAFCDTEFRLSGADF